MARNLSQNLKRIVAGLCAVLVVTGYVPANVGGVKLFDTAITASAAENFSISSVQEWNTFAESVKNGNTYSGKTVMLTADIDSVTTMVEGTFSGIFDGGNHTLTVNISGGSVAVFNTVTNGTIQNLTLAGSVTGTGIHTAALVKSVGGSCTIKNVDINADVNCSGDYIGGFIGNAGTSYTINIENSLFSGNINKTGANKGNFIGAFIGWSQKCTATITNCAFSGSYSNIKSFNNIGFSWRNPTKITVTDFYSNTSDIFVANVNNGVRLYVPESYTALAAQVKSDEGESFYSTFSDALSAWTDNSTLTLLEDVTTASTVSVTGTKTLDLNGYGITKTGSGSVISVGSGANFTLTDSNPSQTHKYSIASPRSNGAGLAAVDDTNGTETFTGGYITGGSVTDNNYGGGITISGNSNVTMNGGTVIGNKGTQECGGVQIGQGSKLTMNGGAVIGNSSYSGGAGINARGILVMTGGTVAYNYASNNGCGGGIRTHGPGGNTSYAEISGGYITNNFASSRAGGIGEGKVILSGSPVIQDNYSSSGKDNIYVLVSNTYFIYINGELTNTTPIGVKLPRGTGVFTRSANTDYNVVSNFTSDNTNYEVIKDSASNQLKLGVHSHAFTYTAEGNTITAECTGEGTCKITEGLTMTISASDATYDGAAHGAELSTDYNTTAFPGNYTIEYYQGDTLLRDAPVNAGNYTAKVTVGNATATVDYTVNAKAVTITAGSAVKTYDGTALTQNGFTATALEVGDTHIFTVEMTSGSTITDVGIQSNVIAAVDGVNITTGSATEVGNYLVTTSDGTLKVNPKDVTVTANAASKTYGGTDPELTYTAEGLVGNDTFTGSLARAAGEDASTYRITQGTLSAGDNYNVTFNGADFTIDKAEITITADDKSTKYKTDIADLTYEIGGGYVEGDDLGVTVSTRATNTSPVGEYDITVGWNNNPNYTATLTNGKYTITKADLTTSATGYDGVYDGEAHSISVDVGSSDAVVYYATTELTANNYNTAGSTTNPEYTNAGEYTVYYYIATDNYDPQPISGSKTVSIARAEVTVTANAASKTYGEADPELTYTAEGLVGNDTFTGELAREAGENVGTYAINQGTLSAGNNYSVTFTGADFTINKAALTVTANSASKTYGEDDPELTYTAEGLVGNDTLTGELARVAGENVGYYAIRQGTLTAGDNYDITFFCAEFTIDQADITITADDKSTQYKSDLAELTYTVGGDYVEGDDLGVTINTDATKTSPVGEYDITVGWNNNPNYTATLTNGKYTITKADLTTSATGYDGVYDGKAHSISVDVGDSDAVVYYGTKELTADNYNTAGSTTNPEYTNAGEYMVYYFISTGNYDPTPVSGSKTVTITKADVTVTAEAKSKTYGETNPALTYTAEGLVGTETLTGALTREEGENVGTYAITQGTLAASDNYTLTFNGADFTISKATLTVTANTASKTYGKDDPELTYTVNGLVGADTLTGELARVAGKNVGYYAIRQGTLTAGDNYDITFIGAVFTIDQAEITITADDKSTQYKSDLAELTYAVGGDYVEGDDLGVTINTDATNTSPVGEYTVTVGWNRNPNYIATLTNGKYTITKADLTTSATGFDGKYDGEAHSISVDVGESDAVVYYGTEELTAENYETAGSTTNPAYTDAGEYTVYFYIVTKNYEADPISGNKNVNIAKADPTVTAPTAKELTYTGEAQALVTAGKTEDGTVVYALSEDGDYSEEIPTGTDAGTFTVWYKVLGDKNHSDSKAASVEVTIAKADAAIKNAPTVTANDLTANGEAQALVTAGETDDGKLVYAVTTDKDKAPSDDAYSEAIPTATDAGTYYVWYKAIGDKNHNDSEPANVEVKIAAPAEEKSEGANPKTNAAAAGMGALALTAAAAIAVSKKKKKE